MARITLVRDFNCIASAADELLDEYSRWQGRSPDYIVIATSTSNWNSSLLSQTRYKGILILDLCHPSLPEGSLIAYSLNQKLQDCPAVVWHPKVPLIDVVNFFNGPNKTLVNYYGSAFTDAWKDAFGQSFEQCFHDWKEYTGIRDKYEYCTKCDQKRI